MRMYFVVSSKENFLTLLELGVRNILVSYFYMPKVGGMDTIAGNVDRLFVDSGAHSALSLGINIDMNEYYDFLSDNQDHIEVAAHFDVVDDMQSSLRNLQVAVDRGMNWVLPVLQGNWSVCKVLYDKVGDWDYYGLGGAYMTFRGLGLTLQDAVNKLPANKKYHGFAKVNFELMRCGKLYSMDSSSWVVGRRFATLESYTRGKTLTTVGLAKKVKGNKLVLRNIYDLYKDDLERANVTMSDLCSEKGNIAMLKFALVTRYKPQIKGVLGQKGYDENFRF